MALLLVIAILIGLGQSSASRSSGRATATPTPTPTLTSGYSDMEAAARRGWENLSYNKQQWWCDRYRYGSFDEDVFIEGLVDEGYSWSDAYDFTQAVVAILQAEC